MEKKVPILAAIIGILCISAPASIELSLHKPFLIGRAYPELAGIKGLYFNIVMPKTKAEKDSSAWNKLKNTVESKLKEAGIEMTTKFDNEHDIICPQLIADVDMFKLEDSNKYIVHIQTSLARAVYLTRDSSWLIKADVWKAQPAMQAASVQDMPSMVTNLVLQQVEAFIRAYHVADSQPGWLSDATDINSTSLAVPKTTSRISSEFVASKNSRIFHKPDCRWAKNISPSNLISYRNREEAIKDGKKPCSTCKP